MSGRSDPGSPGDHGERVDAVLRTVLGGASMRSGLTLGRLLRRWSGVVGEPLGSRTSPLALDRGVLVVAALSPAWAAQVRFLAEVIRARANEELGSTEVHSVRVVVRPERPAGDR